MNLSELAASHGLQSFTKDARLDRPVGGGYAGDLLSDVMAHGRKDDLWVTIQVHPNIVAVAVLKDIAGIVLVNGRVPAEEAVLQAEKEGIPILGTRLSAFELIGRLYGSGIQGS